MKNSTHKIQMPVARCFRWIQGTLAASLLALVPTAWSQTPDTAQKIPNPAAAGLWAGDVTLDAVTVKATGGLEPTTSPGQFRILLHVDSSGKVRLLKDVVIGTRTPVTYFQTVLVTKTSLLGSLPVLRDEKGVLRGQRLATVAYDFADTDSNPTDNALELDGGLGPNFLCTGTLVVGKTHPTNPFRHKYHPDHANDGAKGYEIRRAIEVRFNSPIENIAGIDQLKSGTYRETITGLQKGSVVVTGSIQLNRVDVNPTLNQ